MVLENICENINQEATVPVLGPASYLVRSLSDFLMSNLAPNQLSCLLEDINNVMFAYYSWLIQSVHICFSNTFYGNFCSFLLVHLQDEVFLGPIWNFFFFSCFNQFWSIKRSKQVSPKWEKLVPIKSRINHYPYCMSGSSRRVNAIISSTPDV